MDPNPPASLAAEVQPVSTSLSVGTALAKESFSSDKESSSPTRMGVVKKTCEGCVRSKVKCDGGNPCERCIKKGTECVYLKEQKRGRRTTNNNNNSTTTTPKAKKDEEKKRMKVMVSLPPPPPPPPPPQMQHPPRKINVFHRRKFRILCSLYKFHRHPQDSSWFAARFTQLGQVLQQNEELHFTAQLMHWMKHNGLDTTLFGGSPNSMPVLANLPRLVTHPQDEKTSNRMYLGSIQVKHNSFVVCSPEISRFLGFKPDGTNFPFNGNISFFPFGAGVLAGILETDSQVLAYIRDVAFALNRDTQSCFLLDRPMNVRAVNALNTVVKCFVSCQIQREECTFDFFLRENQRWDEFHVPLPDLELGPWTDNANWLEQLLMWTSKTTPF